MNVFDQLRMQVRQLTARVVALEAAQPARPARPKRAAAPKPTDGIVAARQKLWAQYILLDVSHRGRITYVAFAVKHHLGHPSELSRFFNCTGRRGIAENSATAVRIYGALREATAEAQSRKAHGRDFHGIVADSHASARRPQ